MMRRAITMSGRMACSTRFSAFLKTKPRLILGSYSASRRCVMEEMGREYGFAFEMAAAGIDEKSIRREDPEQLVVTLGYEKARALLQQNAESWRGAQTYLITGDQVVVHDGRILEKPESAEEIRQNVCKFAERPAKTVGSIVCTHIPSGEQQHKIDMATIYMDPIPESTVEQLIAEGAVFASAGGLLAEHPLVSPYVTQIDGGLDAVMGLSKMTVMTLLVQMWQSTDSFASP